MTEEEIREEIKATDNAIMYAFGSRRRDLIAHVKKLNRQLKKLKREEGK